MGVIGTTKIVTGTKKRDCIKTIQPGNREQITIIYRINAKGWALPVLIILKAKLHQATQYTNNNLPHDQRIAVNKNGQTDNQIGFEWIQHFHRYTKRYTKG